jgi:hypothetical protein
MALISGFLPLSISAIGSPLPRYYSRFIFVPTTHDEKIQFVKKSFSKQTRCYKTFLLL